MYHIIVNPASGKRDAHIPLKHLRDMFDGAGIEYDLLPSSSQDETYACALTAFERKSCGIVCIGGDGTVQEVVSGLVRCYRNEPEIGIPVAVLPCGSGDDLVRTLEGGKAGALRKYGKLDYTKSAKAVFDAVAGGRTRRIDVIKASGNLAFLNIANIGIDAKIVYNAPPYKRFLERFKFPGNYAYLAATFETILRHENVYLELVADGQSFFGDYTLVAICNGQYYGGGMHIAPQASMDDGLITLCLVEAMSRPKTMAIFPSLLIGWHTRLREVSFMQCRKLSIKIQDPQWLCLDGNLYDKHSETIDFEVLPGALRVFDNHF